MMNNNESIQKGKKQPILPCLVMIIVVIAFSIIVFISYYSSRAKRIKEYMNLPQKLEFFNEQMNNTLASWRKTNNAWKADVYKGFKRSIYKGDIIIIVSDKWQNIGIEKKREFVEECFHI